MRDGEDVEEMESKQENSNSERITEEEKASRSKEEEEEKAASIEGNYSTEIRPLWWKRG